MSKILGSGSKGRTNGKGFRGGGTTPPGVDMLRPAESGNPDVVQQRAAAATQGKQQQVQLKKNKSKGISSGARVKRVNQKSS